jgi:hypothetical protein
MRFHAAMRFGVTLTLAQVSADLISQDLERRVQPPVVIAFDLNAASRSVLRDAPFLSLTHRITGTAPSEYRVSSRSDFAGATWRPYTLPLRINDWLAFSRQGAACDGAQAGTPVVLYFQVRSQTGSTLKIVDGRRIAVPQMTESNVVMDSICVLKGSGIAPTHSGA